MQIYNGFRSNCKRTRLFVVLPLACALVSSCSSGTTADSDESERSTFVESPPVSDVSTQNDEASTPAIQALADQSATDQSATDQASTDQASTDQASTDQTSTDQTSTDRPLALETSALQVPADLFMRDGYDSIDVVRIDLRTATAPGICTEEDMTGCSLADVNEDVDIYDNFEPEINVQLQATDYANDGSIANAELRQRGATARQFPQKSYRVKIDKDAMKWRNERRLQLNKHPADLSRIRNKLSFDLMSNVTGLPSLRTQFVNLWIDDGQGPVDFGLFTHVESLHKEFLENRGLGEDDNIYKAEQFAFSTADLDAMAVDDSGAPLDTEAFEERLSIKTGADDHSQLIAMLVAINNPAQDFDSVLDRYFDRENVLMWVTVNFLLGQKDITTHNFYLYNPAGSEKFFFLPWDYDAAFYIENELADSLDNNDLKKRLFYGYARGTNSVFLNRYFRLPGINDTIVSAANTLRAGPLSDTEVSERASLYGNVVRPFTTSQPDLENLSISDGDAADEFDSRIEQLSEYVAINQQVLQEGLSIPMPHTLEPPVIVDDQWLLSWSPAFDVTGHSLSYDLQIASDVAFAADAIVFDKSDIPDNPVKVEYSVPVASLPDGPLFYRVIARTSKDPKRYWQVATNIQKIDGTNWYGVQEFE